MLSDIDKAGALDTNAVLDEIAAVFASDGKGNAAAALKLLGRIAGRKGKDDGRALAVVCEALRHSHAEVQAQALTILEKHSGALSVAQRADLREFESFIAASNRSRLLALTSEEGGGEGGAGKAASQYALPRHEVVPAEAYCVIGDDINTQQVLPGLERIEPIASLDALIAAVLHAVEAVDAADEVERIIDAISRMAGDKPADFAARVAPLEHRLKRAASEGSNGLRAASAGAGLAVLDLIYSWITGKLYQTKDERHEYYAHEDGFVPVVSHLRAVTQRVARRQAQALICAPTHKGGWIDPKVWVERLAALPAGTDVADSMDFRLSLLRLAPDNREVARVQAATLPAALRRIVDFALGGDERPLRSDRNAYAMWISAARCRDPLKDWQAEFAPLRLTDEWPDSLRPARYDWKTGYSNQQSGAHKWKLPLFTLSARCGGEGAPPQSVGGLFATLTQGLSSGIATEWTALPASAAVRRIEAARVWSGELHTVWVSQWLAFVWPQNPAAAFMKGARMLSLRMDENSSNFTPGHGHILALFQPNRPWREAGHLLLCLGLAGKDADARGLAIDALIEGIDGRRFNPTVFAGVMTRLVAGEWLKLNRVADSLMSAVQVSRLHAAVVSEAVQKWLPTFDHRQTNASRILEALLEAQAVTGRPLGGGVREALAAIGGGGKATKVAKQLLKA